MSSLRIGIGSLIGAGSVVTKDVPAGAVAVGNPRRVYPKAERLEKLRLVNAELDHRHVCSREDVTEYRPCAVVKAPPLVQMN